MKAKLLPMESQPEKPKGQAGAPIGNANRTRSGKRAWSAVKRLPKGSGAIRRQLYAERDETEAAVVAAHGEINLYHAALIQSSIRHSGRAHLLERWIRVEADMSLSDRLAILREIGNATDSRDKCLQRLGLDATEKRADPWATFDAAQADPGREPAAAGPEAITTADNAPADPLGDGLVRKANS